MLWLGFFVQLAHSSSIALDTKVEIAPALLFLLVSYLLGFCMQSLMFLPLTYLADTSIVRKAASRLGLRKQDYGYADAEAELEKALKEELAGAKVKVLPTNG